MTNDLCIYCEKVKTFSLSQSENVGNESAVNMDISVWADLRPVTVIPSAGFLSLRLISGLQWSDWADCHRCSLRSAADKSVKSASVLKLWHRNIWSQSKSRGCTTKCVHSGRFKSDSSDGDQNRKSHRQDLRTKALLLDQEKTVLLSSAETMNPQLLRMVRPEPGSLFEGKPWNKYSWVLTEQTEKQCRTRPWTEPDPHS